MSTPTLLADQPPDLVRAARENYYEALGHVPKLAQRMLDNAVDAGYRHIGLFTPPQDGKSYHIAKHVGAFWVFPGTHIWIVAPTYEDGSKEFGYIYGDWARLGLLRTARSKHFDTRGGNMRVELKNESWVQVITAKDQENLRREQLDVVVYAEASKLDENLHNRYVYSRVEKRRGKTYYPTTHKGYGWVYTDVRCRSLPVKDRSWTWGPWRRDPEGGMSRERIGGEANPDYDPAYWSVQVSYVPDFGEVLHEGEYSAETISQAKARLLPQFFAEQFGGEACSYAGLVYPFDPAWHECDVFPIPDSWSHVVGYDHGAGGGADPTAVIFGSYAPDGTLYVWHEIYGHAQQSIAAYASMIRIVLRGKVPQFIMRGRDAKQVGTEMLQAGMNTMFPVETTIEARVVRLGQLFMLRKIKILRGRCPNLKRELLNYEWDDKRIAKVREYQSDHALEALGYLSLAPVSLPVGPMPNAYGEHLSLADRQRRDLLWGEYRKARTEEAEQAEYRRFMRMVDPDPLAEYAVVEDARY